MSRKKIEVSDLSSSQEPLCERIARLFSTENIIKNFSKNNMSRFKKVIESANIQLILHEKPLMNTIYAFFDNNLNISITSDKAFMHRNTLNYRLDKIARYTGLNLRLFEHALLFKNLILIDSLIKDYEEVRRIKRSQPDKVGIDSASGN